MPAREGARRTPAQRKASEAMALSPKEQASRWRTHSGDSPRLHDTYARLGALLRDRFEAVEEVFDYNMRGFAIRRRVAIAEWTGTMDPNWIRLYVAERRQGITIHVWDPCDPGALQRATGLAEAGFRPMVGCVQYNRKGEVPVQALAPLLDAVRARYDAEGPS